jgi:uncharacterized protein
VRGWDKETRRAVFQGFNFPILCVCLAVYAAAGLLNAELWRLVLVALPGTMTDAWTGSQVYRRMSAGSTETTAVRDFSRPCRER